MARIKCTEWTPMDALCLLNRLTKSKRQMLHDNETSHGDVASS